MERRNFIKKSIIAAGTLPFVHSGLAAGTKGSAISAATGSALAGDAFAEIDAGAGEHSMHHAGVEQAPLLKSIMWGTVGMQGTVLEKCKAIKAAGYAGIEPNSHMDRKEVLDAMKATGLKASSVCNSKHWELPMSHPDADVRRKGIDAMIVAMEDAAAYGTDAVLLVPGRVDVNTSYEDCWKRSTECVKELVPIAEKMKIKICIENVWNDFLLSPIEMKMYLKQFDSPYVRMYFDCGNILVYGWPEQWIATLGNLIGRIHIKEFSRQKADKEGRWAGFGVQLTEGDVRWQEVMAEIRRSYNGGWLTTEQGSSKTPDELKDLSGRLDKILAYY